ncbi:TNR21 factor, partial [Polypterus senegalus]|nr:tumor necrosis factor receptor superfamily member 1B-like isoform X1 [Polypterus senegalus]MBN3291202.1 TNR21 factor [Polypterus senegalus]
MAAIWHLELLLGMLFIQVQPSFESEADMYTIKDNAGITIHCRKCSAGQKVVNDCTTDKETECGDCESETYMDYPSNMKKCLACRKPCGKYEEERLPCTRTQKRECKCKDNAYLLDSECVRHRPCFPGHGVYKPGTNVSNVMCKRCVNAYSDVTSSTATCKPHTNCLAKNLTVIAFGNTSADNVCGPKPIRSVTKPSLQNDKLIENISSSGSDKSSEPNGSEKSTGCWCWTTERIAIVSVIGVCLLTFTVLGWSLYFKKKKKFKRHIADLTQVDKKWMFSCRKTGDRKNALHLVAQRIGKDWTQLLGELGFTKDWRNIREEHRDVYSQALEGLRLWTQWEEESSLELLKKAAKGIDRNDICETLDLLEREINKKAYKDKDSPHILQCIRERKSSVGTSNQKEYKKQLKKPLLQSISN